MSLEGLLHQSSGYANLTVSVEKPFRGLHGSNLTLHVMLLEDQVRTMRTMDNVARLEILNREVDFTNISEKNFHIEFDFENWNRSNLKLVAFLQEEPPGGAFTSIVDSSNFDVAGVVGVSIVIAALIYAGYAGTKKDMDGSPRPSSAMSLIDSSVA